LSLNRWPTARVAPTNSEQSKLPKRLVIEALIRLMRADRVAVTQSSSGTIFHANSDGKSKAQFDELPNFPQRFICRCRSRAST
jgi:cardiolipin synthase